MTLVEVSQRDDREAASAPPMPRVERARRVPFTTRARRARRPVLIMVVVVLIAVLVAQVHERVVSALVHEQRQQRLALDYREPAPERVVRPGEPIAVIQSVAIGLNQVVVEGDTTAHLRGGPARRTGSALPGEPGRTVILGRHRMYGGPFSRIGELVDGDVVAIQTRNGGPIVPYVVREVIVDAEPADVPAPDEGVAQLVLVSSDGGWTGSARTVVVASTLPVIDSPPRVEPLTFGASDGGSPFGVDALVANVALASCALAWIGLRRRYRVSTVVAVVSPIGLFALVSYLLVIDSILPATR